MTAPHDGAVGDARKRAEQRMLATPSASRLVAAVEKELDGHLTEDAGFTGCRLACGYDDDDLSRHLAERVVGALLMEAIGLVGDQELES